MPYIGTSPSNGVRRVHTYTATASQTTFTGASSEGVTLSYADTNYIDVFQNGVLLGSADYTSTSGTSVVLAQGASADDLIVIVVYDVFSVADTVSKTNGGTFDNGITIDEDGATVLTVDRATSDGTIVDLQKDGSSVGTIGVTSSDQMFFTRATGSQGIKFKNSALMPSNADGSDSDNDQDIGSSSVRWKDLYLSGGAYLGGTGSANKLDDYEEGSFTPTFGGSGGNQTVSYSIQLGTYVKVGKLVYVNVSVIATGTPSGGSGDLIINGLPFTSKSGVQQAGSIAFANNLSFGSSGTQGGCNVEGGVTYLNINSQELVGTSSMSRVPASGIHNSAPRIVCTICYETA